MGNAFSTYHPAAAFTYLACAIVLAMAALHPVCAALSLAGAFACSCACRSVRASLASLAWALPLAAVVAVANLAFSATGSTELFRIGARAFYLEALAYGACSGTMLAAVLLWFSSYAACMNSESTLALFGGVAPVAALLVSQVLRLVPQFVSRGRGVQAVADATSAAAPATKRDQGRARLRTVSVLMGWGMEDSLVRSDSMRARGFGCGARRTTYQRHRIRRADAALIVVTLMLAAATGIGVWAACAQVSFYPRVEGLGDWRLFVPYAMFLLIPVALRARGQWLWR